MRTFGAPRQFPAVAETVARVSARTAVIDGEIVALDADGRSCFQALHHWSIAGLSIYPAGRRSEAWVKVRFAKHQEFVIGGFRPNATSFLFISLNSKFERSAFNWACRGP